MVIANVNTPRVSIEVHVKWVYSQGKQQSYSFYRGFGCTVVGKDF